MEHGAVKSGVIAVVAIAASFCAGSALAQGDEKDTSPPAVAAPAPAPAPAPANSSGDTPSSMVGAWELSNADHDKICRFNFRTDTVPGGNKLDIDKNCPNLFPSTKEIAAWAMDNYGNLRLVDTHGNSVIELTEVESGMYDGFTPEEGRYILQTAAAVPQHAASDMVGDWGVTVGGGKPICVITLTNNPVATDILALKIKPGCDSLVTRFGPGGWRMAEGELELLSPRGQSWQFEENGTNSWQRVPESSDPILLVRQ